MLYVLPLFMLTVAASAATNCAAPVSDWIYGRDLARVVPALAGLSAEMHAGYAPVPGMERVFHPAELRRLALANHLPDPGLTGNVCFAWPLAPLTSAAITGAMERALTGRQPRIEITGQSAAPAPAGELVFPLAGLSAISDKPAVWKGYVLYGGGRRFNTWAIVRLLVRETHLLANGPLRAGERLTSSGCRSEKYEGPLPHEALLTDCQAAAGLVARRAIADGTALIAAWFEAPREVASGDLVAVQVLNGATRLETQGIALAGGRRGEIIQVRNQSSGQTYRARVIGDDQVLVVPGGPAGLLADRHATENTL